MLDARYTCRGSTPNVLIMKPLFFRVFCLYKSPVRHRLQFNYPTDKSWQIDATAYSLYLSLFIAHTHTYRLSNTPNTHIYFRHEHTREQQLGGIGDIALKSMRTKKE